MKVYLGLGSNLGDRRGYLAQAVAALAGRPLRILRVAPVVESPAMLPGLAPPEWNRPYLNTVLECECQAAPQQIKGWTKEIQQQIAGDHDSRWAPRALDIDLLVYGDAPVRQPKLRIPARDLHKRPFVLSPLVHLQPDLRLPGREERTVLEWSRSLRHHIPLWMGIVNVTPDSFSDGGLYQRWPQIEALIDEMIAAGVHIIDVGAESTRPGATVLTADEEWARLQPVLEPMAEKLRSEPLGPRISVDTRNPRTAERALDLGADLINDVSGLSNPAMVELARSSNCDWIAMHHLTLPADPKVVIAADQDPLKTVETWILERLDVWDKAGLDRARIILDPGIGFGKNALQSLELMRQLTTLRSHGLRVLVGPSRKSFMAGFTGPEARQRDLTTVGASLALCQQGVDIIRVHDVPSHVSAYLGWAHLRCQSLKPLKRATRKPV